MAIIDKFSKKKKTTTNASTKAGLKEKRRARIAGKTRERKERLEKEAKDPIEIAKRLRLEARGDPEMTSLLADLEGELGSSKNKVERVKNIEMSSSTASYLAGFDPTKSTLPPQHNSTNSETTGTCTDATTDALANLYGSSGASFEDLHLIEPLKKAVAALGYTAPSPIQQRAIPLALNGKDVLAGAQTGTGKTAAFAIPILQQLAVKTYGLYAKEGDAHTTTSIDNELLGKLRALILTPTRELAAQIETNFTGLTHFFVPKSPFSASVIVGGVPAGPQIYDIKHRKPTIVIATPGRLLEYAKSKVIRFENVSFCVLDEADRMLDMGFYPDVSKILAMLPKEKQSLLFSATFSPEIRRLASTLLRAPAAEVQVTPPNSTVERIQQCHYLVGRDKKDEALVHIITKNNWSQVLVFTRTKGGANSVSAMLVRNGITALAIHGGKSQNARTGALSDFKSGKLRVLVATDIAARGIDISDLPHVINYELPNVPEDYVHRIGRTGRAGKAGYAVSLVCRDEEGFLHNIIRFAGKADIPLKEDIPESCKPAKGEKAEPIAMGQMTLWGGAGPMPSRAVMDAATKAKRAQIAGEMRERKQKEQAARIAKGARMGGRGSGNNQHSYSRGSGRGGFVGRR